MNTFVLQQVAIQEIFTLDRAANNKSAWDNRSDTNIEGWLNICLHIAVGSITATSILSQQTIEDRYPNEIYKNMEKIKNIYETFLK